MAVFARAVMQLAENKVPLARDVIFVVEADEEAAPYNTTWLAQTHWADIDCEFALNEGGWIMADDDGHVKYVSISTADKSSVAVILTAPRHFHPFVDAAAGQRDLRAVEGVGEARRPTKRPCS